MMQQYLDIKKEYQDAILFFRLGDFYEMFFEDAVKASSILEITLTGRDAGRPERVPMCGVPYHAADIYIARLINKGIKVAICDQVEDPSSAKGIVRREVVRVVTPGTVIEGASLDEKCHNYIVSVIAGDNGYGLAMSDVSTGLFRCTQFSAGKDFSPLIDEIARISPAEIIMLKSQATTKVGMEISSLYPSATTLCNDNDYSAECIPDNNMSSFFGGCWREISVEHPLAVSAAKSLLSYLLKTQKKDARQIKKIEYYYYGQFMMIDRSTRRNLELTTSIRGNGKWGTLIWVMDRTKTAMGGRMLRTWIEQPLTDPPSIISRLDAVEEIKGNLVLRNDLAKILGKVSDIERLASRVVYGTANARDMVSLRNSLSRIRSLLAALEGVKAKILRDAVSEADSLADICELLHKSITDEPPAGVREGGIIKNGYNSDVDRLKRIQRDGKSWLIKLEAEEREKSGIKSLKIGYNKVFGYYFEVTRANLDLVPPHFIRKQTLANAERFITQQLKDLEDQLLSAEDRLYQLEYELFNEIREIVAGAVDRLQKTSAAIALVDVILSLAEVAVEENYNRPRISNIKEINIRGGRHPVVEKVLGAGKFVPNDTVINDKNNVIIITGPNMAGKSTYMRQVALIVLMAQVGSFVPAEDAEIGVVDRIFTRIGAADDLAGGQSTFMVEMTECKNIIDWATDKSLVLMDEVGRGTSTYDGISIARALVEYIVKNIGSRTLFSTHYHELTDMDALEGIVNYTITVKEQDQRIIFLRKVMPGKADRSYGIHVAALAGLPVNVIKRAREILSELERAKTRDVDTETEMAGIIPPSTEANGRGDGNYLNIITELRETDILNTTPLKALNILEKLKQMI
ncbi:MAG: DNA mismatch repair protein MutS [Bacillota bacterium]